MVRIGTELDPEDSARKLKAEEFEENDWSYEDLIEEAGKGFV